MNKDIINARLAIMSGNPVAAIIHGEVSEESGLEHLQCTEIFHPDILKNAIEAGRSFEDIFTAIGLKIYTDYWPVIASYDRITTVTWTGHIIGMEGVN